METIKCEMKAKGLTMEVDKQEFALALRTYRLRQALTQRQLAALWGVGRDAILKAENGQNISWMMAYRLFAKLSAALKEEGEK